MEILRMKRLELARSQYSAINFNEIKRSLLNLAAEGSNGYVCISNVHTTMIGFFNSSYRQITNDSLFSVPDGMPLVWAMNTLGVRGQRRVRGPTLMRELVQDGRSKGIRHFLFGGTPAAVRALQAQLELDYPGCEIVAAESPPFRPLEAITDEEWQASAEKINQTKPHFIWVGLGAPKQELWMAKQRNSVKGIMIGVGAAFEIIPGRVQEAPMLVQKLGLEWLFRLVQEPRRLWKRYIFNNPAFLAIWGFQVFRHSIGKNYFVE
jgi:N-acetylglucosaminyldiphosphoundecaprenol N-acetyl-beta-D-mannosaminyltransferase